jgi:serpin B
MTVLLPEAGRFEEIRTALTGAWLAAAQEGMSDDTEVTIAMPKFKFTWGTESFKEPLKAMGMTDAFVYPTADFSGMETTRELYIADVLHQAFVGVDEHGTEAAAATAVLIASGAIPDPKFVTIDRPFLFFVQDDTGALLFVGQVADPTG